MPPPTQPRTQQSPGPRCDEAVLLPLDLEPLRPLLDHLADLVAERLARKLARQHIAAEAPASRRLLTLHELIALLPPGKKADTWRGWLYQRTRIPDQVPGQHKLGGRLFFDPEQTLPWLLNQPTSGAHKPGLDLAAQQSLHAEAVPHEPGQAPQHAREC